MEVVTDHRLEGLGALQLLDSRVTNPPVHSCTTRSAQDEKQLLSFFKLLPLAEGLPKIGRKPSMAFLKSITLTCTATAQQSPTPAWAGSISIIWTRVWFSFQSFQTKAISNECSTWGCTFTQLHSTPSQCTKQQQLFADLSNYSNN